MKLKVFTGISIVIFSVFMTGLFTYGMYSYVKHKEKNALEMKAQTANNKLVDAGIEGDTTLSGVLSIETVSTHNKPTDCWLIIENNVYDVTLFAGSHPGGSNLVIQYCGNEATSAFKTRDRNPQENHSNFARNLLRSYYIGPLGRVPNQILFPNGTNPGQPIVSKPILSPGGIVPKNISMAPANNANTQTNLVIDQAEVSRHGTLQNCWLIISGKVFDITSFSASHPGGQAAISPYCGKDGTQAFQSRGGSGSHSSYAYSLLNNYLIANLGSTVTVNTSGSANPTPTSMPIFSNNGSTATPTTVPTNNSPTPIPQTRNLTLTTAEVSTRNTLQNCWLIISNRVYDVTRFISQHPGGVSAMTNYCGKESTTAFQSRGGSGSHSSYAYSLLNNYLIGTIGATVPVNATPTSVPGGATTAPGASTNTPTTFPTGGTCASNIPQSICSLYSGSTVTRQSGQYEDNSSWEGQVMVNGSCRHIQTNSSGNISSNSPC